MTDAERLAQDVADLRTLVTWIASERLNGHRSEPEGRFRDALRRLSQPPQPLAAPASAPSEEMLREMAAQLMSARCPIIPIEKARRLVGDRPPHIWELDLAEALAAFATAERLRPAAPTPATVEEIERIIFEADPRSNTREAPEWMGTAARRITALGFGVPAEIASEAKEIVAQMDDNTLSKDGSFFRRYNSECGHRNAAAFARRIAALGFGVPAEIASEAKEIVAQMDDNTLSKDGSFFRRYNSECGHRNAAAFARRIAAREPAKEGE